MARLMAYKLVAKTGAMTKKPESEPANNQNRSCANQVIRPPHDANNRPCSVLNQGDLAKSLNPRANQCKGWSKAMGKTGGKKTGAAVFDEGRCWGSDMHPA